MMRKKKKFHQKEWFTWFMILLFFPIGLILLWKNDFYVLRGKVFFTIIILLLVSAGGYGTYYVFEQKQIEEQKKIIAIEKKKEQEKIKEEEEEKKKAEKKKELKPLKAQEMLQIVTTLFEKEKYIQNISILDNKVIFTLFVEQGESKQIVMEKTLLVIKKFFGESELKELEIHWYKDVSEPIDKQKPVLFIKTNVEKVKTVDLNALLSNQLKDVAEQYIENFDQE